MKGETLPPPAGDEAPLCGALLSMGPWACVRGSTPGGSVDGMEMDAVTFGPDSMGDEEAATAGAAAAEVEAGAAVDAGLAAELEASAAVEAPAFDALRRTGFSSSYLGGGGTSGT